MFLFFYICALNLPILFEVTMRKYFWIIIAPVIFVIFCWIHPLGESIQLNGMAGIVLWMAIWWFSECVHLAVTSLLPLILVPLCDIASIKEVSKQYGDSIIFLFLGGFLISIAIEKWDLHKRIARSILKVTGQSTNGLLAGVMISTFLLSNWISNTATALMMFGVIMALIKETEHILHKKEHHLLASALMLGMAYAASIGGMATPVGTPPNMYFFKVYPQLLNNSFYISFWKWILYFFPLSLIILFGCFWILKILILNKISTRQIDFKSMEIHREFKLTYEEKVVGSVFIFTVILWLTRDISFGNIKGWKYLLNHSDYIDDSVVAITSAVLLFIIPSKKNKGQSILVWDDVKQLKYDILLLFGGGFALAYGFEKSGLMGYLIEPLKSVSDIHPFIIILIICIVVVIVSEFASNIASVQLALPVISVIALQFANDKSFGIVLSCVLASSVGFMLPVATAPNTIAYGSGYIPLPFMLKTGFWLNVFCIFTITIYSYFVL